MKHIEIQKAYLDYVNNYLTLDAFASAYDISKQFAAAIIKEGKNINSKIGPIGNSFDHMFDDIKEQLDTLTIRSKE